MGMVMGVFLPSVEEVVMTVSFTAYLGRLTTWCSYEPSDAGIAKEASHRWIHPKRFISDG
jgi:hypothetical protein